MYGVELDNYHEVAKVEKNSLFGADLLRIRMRTWCDWPVDENSLIHV